MDALLGPPSRTKQSGKGVMSTWAPARGLYATRVVGHMDGELAAQLIAGGNEVIARDGSLLGFHDWSGIVSYDTAARKKLTEWGYEVRNEVERVHILVASKIVRMGVSVASIVLLGMLVSHDDVSAFEACLREELGARRLKPAPMRAVASGKL